MNKDKLIHDIMTIYFKDKISLFMRWKAKRKAKQHWKNVEKGLK